MGSVGKPVPEGMDSVGSALLGVGKPGVEMLGRTGVLRLGRTGVGIPVPVGTTRVGAPVPMG